MSNRAARNISHTIPFSTSLLLMKETHSQIYTHTHILEKSCVRLPFNCKELQSRIRQKADEIWELHKEGGRVEHGQLIWSGLLVYADLALCICLCKQLHTTLFSLPCVFNIRSLRVQLMNNRSI